MGIRKSGWIIWGSLLILVVCLSTWYTVHHLLRAKAATNETIDPQTTQYSKSDEAKSISDMVKGTELEKEWLQKQQDKAVAENRRLLEKQITTIPVTKPAVVTAPAPKPTQPPAKNTNTTTPVMPPVQPSNGGKRIVYLTFDDGPEVFSKDIIALLEKYHFKATFFMLEPNIKRYPDSVKAMVQAGEGLGLHGVTHNKNLFYASESSVLGEMDQDRNTLKSITGVSSVIIRTPYGSAPYMTPAYKKAVADHGYRLWDWNIDSRDWDYKDERYVTSVIDQIAKRGNRSGPIVILLHEKRETLASLPKLLDYLSKQNFECKAIDSSITPVHF
jgi:peptidoglycan/xylan/chitin deacetylase (PgdA/CDA1 family)